jgi:hypothetical protein
MQVVKRALDIMKPDIVGIMEVDLMWRLLPSDVQLDARTFGWFDCFSR